MSEIVSFFARLGELIAAFGQRAVGILMGRFRSQNCRLDGFDFLASRSGIRVRSLRRALRVDPTGVQQTGFDTADFFGQLAIAFGCASLAAQLSSALLLIAEDLAEPRKIGLCCAELLLGV